MNDVLSLYHRWNLKYKKLLDEDFSNKEIISLCKTYIEYKQAGGKRKNDYIEKLIKYHGVNYEN